MDARGFVSVVIPVYNGARYLAECVESVLGQSHGDLELVVFDNHSADGTREIAERYARQDRRVRVVGAEETVPAIENWNRAVAEISPRSAFCRVLHADDTMYPACLERSLEVAARNPTVGIVGSLRRRGEGVECEGVPEGRERLDGAEVARWFLRGTAFVFAPTSSLVRSDLVRARRPFYPTAYLHADLAAFLDLFDRTDYGFVDEILSFSRTHDESLTETLARPMQTLLREKLTMLQEFGPRYFAPDELDGLIRDYLRRYRRLIVRGALLRRGPDFLGYHLNGLREAGHPPGLLDFAGAVASEISSVLVRPGRACSHLRDVLGHR